MKIGYDAKRAFFNNRGLGNYSRNTIQLMSRFYPEEEFFLFSPKKTEKGIVFQQGEHSMTVTPKGIWNPFGSLWRTFGMVSDIRKLGLDIYHGLSHEIPVGIEKTHTKSVVTMHDVIFLQFPELYPYIDRMLYKQKYLRSCEKSDRIIAISNQTKESLIEYGHVEGEKIEVIYQAVNPLYEKRVSEEEKNQVRHRYHLPMSFMLTVGAVERRKNQLLILKAIEKGRIDMPLVIVGRHTDYIEELKQYISSERMENQVMFLTSLSDQELAVVYQMSELFLFPSLFEGWGAPIIEAITSGVPVITSTGSCFHETAGDAAIYVHPDNVEEMESSIQKVLGDSSVRKEMIERGMRYVRQFTEESVANKLMKVYKSLR